ncbi:MAG: hypothetical protein QXZ70_06175 [Candidatus Bathyarchaeia archaeon]
MSNKSKELDFKSLVDPSLWKDYETFIRSADKRLEEDIKKSINKRKELRKILLEDPQLKQRIRPRKEESDRWDSLLKWAEDELFSGNVAAVDGTISNFSMVSGTRCRIGVISTSYKNKRIEKVLYVSERELAEPSSSVIEHFEKLRKKHRISALLLRALMLYGERQIALSRSEAWKLVHGELLPYELRTGLGIYRALPESLELGRKLIEAKNVIAVIEDTTRLNLLNAGIILERGEYMEALTLKEYFENNYLPTAHFSRDDEALFKEFVKDYCDNVRIGVYRVGFKPYVFEAHKDVFDKAAALIMKDAENQPMRGFPLLIDYADAICSCLLSGSDFQRQIMFKTAKASPDTFGFEMIARTTRRR